MDTLIPNHQLVLERIPDPDGDLAGWVVFAHTIDGYAAGGGFKACAELANHNTASTLTQLRCALFFEARRDRHSGGLSDVKPAVRTLLRAIRAKVASQELE